MEELLTSTNESHRRTGTGHFCCIRSLCTSTVQTVRRRERCVTYERMVFTVSLLEGCSSGYVRVTSGSSTSSHFSMHFDLKAFSIKQVQNVGSCGRNDSPLASPVRRIGRAGHMTNGTACHTTSMPFCFLFFSSHHSTNRLKTLGHNVQ